LKRTYTTCRTRMNESSQACSVAGRVLLLLAAVLLAVTPWTEYFWHFDNFLHGGQDLELGLLSVVTVLCLVLLLVQHGKQRVASIASIPQLLSHLIAHQDTRVPGRLGALGLVLAASHQPDSSLSNYNPPLLV
jgi:cytochrome bd-type quinol oxidase subunit 2